MNCANGSAYESQQERLIALGYSYNPSTTIWLDAQGKEQMLVRNGGMISPVRREVPAGTMLYKYTDTRQGANTYLSSGWWFERASLDQVISYATQNKVPEGYAVRLLGCVPPEWGSNLDLVVSARLNCDLAAFRGLAHSAHGRDAHGTTCIDAQNDIAALRMPQLYVPGLRDPASGKPTGRHQSWFQLSGTWPVRNEFSWIYRATR